MRRLILQTSISIDGYVAALDGSHPWDDGSEDEAVVTAMELTKSWEATPGAVYWLAEQRRKRREKEERKKK